MACRRATHNIVASTSSSSKQPTLEQTKLEERALRQPTRTQPLTPPPSRFPSNHHSHPRLATLKARALTPPPPTQPKQATAPVEPDTHNPHTGGEDMPPQPTGWDNTPTPEQVGPSTTGEGGTTPQQPQQADDDQAEHPQWGEEGWGESRAKHRLSAPLSSRRGEPAAGHGSQRVMNKARKYIHKQQNKAGNYQRRPPPQRQQGRHTQPAKTSKGVRRVRRPPQPTPTPPGDHWCQHGCRPGPPSPRPPGTSSAVNSILLANKSPPTSKHAAVHSSPIANQPPTR